MAITALPTPPSRQSPATFADRTDAFLGALPGFQTEANALAIEMNGTAAAAENYATYAAESKNTAVAAAASLTTVAWVSGTTYAIGDARWSPMNYLPYRRKTAGAGTTDPSQDDTNWALVALTAPVTPAIYQSIGGL